MSTRRYVPPTRPVAGPKPPTATEVRLSAPVEISRPVPASKLRILLPVVGVAAVVGMVVLFARSGMARSPMTMFFPVMMIMSMAGMAGMYGGGNRQGSAELNEDRKDYLLSLSEHRDTVRQADTELYAHLAHAHPGPRRLRALVGGARMWEVQTGHPQFLRLRVGLGRIPNQVRIIVPEAGPPETLDPVCRVELARFAKAYTTVAGMPIATNLLSVSLVGLRGDRAAVAGLARAMLAEACALHRPDHVAVAAAVADPDGPEWAWLKWLPHTQHRTDTDPAGTARMVYGSVAELKARVVTGLNRAPFSPNAPAAKDRVHMLLVVDLPESQVGERDLTGFDGCTWVRLGAPAGEPAGRTLMFSVDGDGTLFEDGVRGRRRVGVADAMDVSAAEVLARRMARWRLGTVADVVADKHRGRTWADLVGVADPGMLDPAAQWPPRADADRARLAIPFGHDQSGVPVHLDIKEPAEEGMGPHGMCIGATGSGKSEFLRTLVLSLVATHSPDAVNLLLVDFKGGATFLGFDRLHHVTAVVTNMEEEADLVTRMEDVINGELARRQRVLRDAGNYASVADYERDRELGAPHSPLPTLFIILDEFAELLEQYPDFAKLFVAIGRLGRSLRIHLLLASQKVPQTRMGELEAHLSYRIALRTNQTSDSRDAIGTADAYHLPKQPGSGYLRVGSGDLQRFQSAYVGLPYVAPAGRESAGTRKVAAPVGYVAPRRFSAADVAEVAPALRPPADTEGADAAVQRAPAEQVTVMETVLGRLARHGTPAHRMWLPPLGVAPALDTLIDAVAPGTLRLPLALMDRPRDQRQDVYCIDVSAAGGHVAVVGAPQSGKSTALQTFIAAAALTHTPEQVQFYCLDFSGGALAALKGLPHVGSVAQSRDKDRVRRTMALVGGLIGRRQTLFSEFGIDSMREFRRRKANPAEAAELAARDPYGDVFLVVDGWEVATGHLDDDWRGTLETIAVQGLNYGIHLVFTASRWMTVRPAIKDLVSTRVEMRLGDTADTVYSRFRAAVAQIPVGRPGRCIAADGLHMLTALPRIDGSGDAETAGAGLAELIEAVRARCDTRAPEVKLLPDSITLAELTAAAPEPVDPAQRLAVPFGVRESDLSAAAVDFGVSTHLIVLGSSGSGKTEALATLLASIQQRFTADQARILLVDYRRRHIDAIAPEYLIGHMSSEAEIVAGLGSFVQVVNQRKPPPGISGRDLAKRAWLDGYPEVFVVIDDYHMVVQRGGGNPLDPLRTAILDGRDTGVHVVAARNIAQAEMALYDMVLGQMRNLNSSAVILNGSRQDGILVGDVKATAQPPGRGIYVEPMNSRKDLVQIALPPADPE